MSTIPTPNDLLTVLREEAIINPIVNMLSEEIIKELHDNFTIESIEQLERVAIKCTVHSEKLVSDVHTLKDKIFDVLNAKFRTKGWLFTKYALHINVQGSGTEISFSTQCEAMAHFITTQEN